MIFVTPLAALAIAALTCSGCGGRDASEEPAIAAPGGGIPSAAAGATGVSFEPPAAVAQIPGHKKGDPLDDDPLPDPFEPPHPPPHMKKDAGPPAHPPPKKGGGGMQL